MEGIQRQWLKLRNGLGDRRSHMEGDSSSKAMVIIKERMEGWQEPYGGGFKG